MTEKNLQGGRRPQHLSKHFRDTNADARYLFAVADLVLCMFQFRHGYFVTVNWLFRQTVPKLRSYQCSIIMNDESRVIARAAASVTIS